jgi:hypothetical protein
MLLKTSKDQVKEPGEYFPDQKYKLFWFICPCGRCRGRSAISLGKKDGEPSPSWDFNDKTQSLHPSLNIVDHWHGWLKNGTWRKC